MNIVDLYLFAAHTAVLRAAATSLARSGQTAAAGGFEHRLAVAERNPHAAVEDIKAVPRPSMPLRRIFRPSP